MAEGPYRFVRNPMISGVIILLLGEAFALRSQPHLEWAGLFALINESWLLWDPRRQCLHDKAAGTVVVKKAALAPGA